MARKLVVEIVGDASSLDRSFKRAARSSQEFEKDMGRLTRGTIAGSGAFSSLGRSVAFASGGFLTGAGITAGIKASVVAASDLEQQISKTNVVFGESGQEVNEWAKTTADAFGVSQRQALTLASTFGALLRPLGLTGPAAAEQSKALVELGADLASFYNTDVQSALDAIRSGIVGEAEPLRNYSVRLSETRVQQQALNDTGKQLVANLTDQEKAAARVKIIFQDTAQAQGDFARTSDDLAQQLKIAQANADELAASLGKNLIPALTEIVGLFNSLAAAREKATRSEIGKFLFGSVFDQFRSFKNTTEDLLTDLNLIEKKTKAVLPPAGIRGPVSVGVQPPAGILGPAGEIGLTRKQRAERRARGREAREAFRQEVQERAQLAVERTRLTESVADDIAALQRLNALLTRRIRGGHDVIANEREQITIQLQINDLIRQQADAARERAEAARHARDARQFRLLGFGPTGEDLVPGVGVLKRQLATLQDVIAGSFLDTRKTRGLLGHIRQILAGGLGSVSADVRRRIQEILADLRNQLKQSSVDVTRFQHSARGQLTLAGAHPGGALVIHNANFYGVQNVPQLETELQKRKKQRARQRRSTR